MPARKPGCKARRLPRPGSLRNALVEALMSKGKLSVAEAAEAVKAAGCKSKSRNLHKVVGITLSQSRQFRRVRRGVYALKS